LTLLVLDWSGYVSNAATQKPTTILAIRVLTGPVPALLLLAGIVFAFFYPLSRAGHAQTRREIAARNLASQDH
jgi:GPH family glycoside/pentoside/hexuronide:cation symporter